MTPSETSFSFLNVFPKRKPVLNREDERKDGVLFGRFENRAEVLEDENLRRANIRYWIARITYFVLGMLEIILLLRLIFRLLGANQGSTFVMFLYNQSHVFVAPFNGIFNDQAPGRSVFEISTLVAMVVYALVAWGIVALGNLIFAPKYSGRQSTTTTHRNRYS